MKTSDPIKRYARRCILGKRDEKSSDFTKNLLTFSKDAPFNKVPVFLQGRIPRNQSGLASVVVVSVLVVVLSLISIGFSRDMDRAVRQSANSSLGTAATYAARSGINDAISYVTAKPTATASNCNDILTDNSSDTAKILANLSGDGSTKYTCLLINPTPTDLAYQKINSFKSQVVRINPTANLSKLMFSWQATDQTNTGFPASGISLLDETTWGTNKYQPILRLSLYAIPTAVSGSDALQYLVNNGSYKTFFLYPNRVASASPSVTEISWSLGDGSLQNVNCADVHSATFNTGDFSGSADNNCNIIIINLPNTEGYAPYYYYARITPLYTDASIIIKGNDAANSALQLINTQAIVDVTAKSGSATKRLQARVDIASSSGPQLNISSLDDAFPEYAIRSSGTLCKQLQVLDTFASVRTDPATKTDCSVAGSPPITEPSPPIPDTKDASNVTTSSAKLNGTIDVKGEGVTNCYFKFGTSAGGYTSNRDCARPFPTAAGGASAPVSADVSDLNQYTNYYFQLCAANRANLWDNGDICDGEKTFITLANPPTVTVSVSSPSINTGQSTTINWGTTGIVTICTASGDWSGSKPSSGSTSTGTLNTARTYTYTLKCDGPGGSDTKSASLTVTTPPRVTVNVDAYTKGNSGCTTNNGWSCFFWNITTSGTYTTISCSNNILSPQENYNIGLAGNNQDGNPGGQTNWQVQCTTYSNGVENGFGIINTPVNTYQAPALPPPVVNPDPFYCDWAPCVFDPVPSLTPTPSQPDSTPPQWWELPWWWWL